MEEILVQLQGKDQQGAYELTKRMIAESAVSERYYPYLEDFVGLLKHKSSFVRTRGFCLACAQARWDRAGKFKENLGQLLQMLHDEKPTAVRQCLFALREVLSFQPELTERILEELKQIDLKKYKDSMSPLISRDIEILQKIGKGRSTDS